MDETIVRRSHWVKKGSWDIKTKRAAHAGSGDGRERQEKIGEVWGGREGRHLGSGLCADGRMVLRVGRYLRSGLWEEAAGREVSGACAGLVTERGMNRGKGETKIISSEHCPTA